MAVDDSDDDQQQGITVQSPTVVPTKRPTPDETPVGTPKELSSEEVERVITDSFKTASLRQKALSLWRLSLQHSIGVSPELNVFYRAPFIAGKERERAC